MEIRSDYRVSEEDMRRMFELAGVESFEFHDEDAFDETVSNEADFELDQEALHSLLAEMLEAGFSTTQDHDRFFYFYQENMQRIQDAVLQCDDAKEMLLLCFKMAINQGGALSMNCLGALYYLGDIVEQNYVRAAELYEMAMDAGCYQSIINLGYIYEYGRIGEPDYQKAYQFYSLAAALAPSSEAAYKLGGMFSRGQAVPRDMAKAHALYVRSFRLAETDEEIAQPAIRIARMLIDPDGPSYGVESDPLEALSLFQRAEIGLRKDIENGMVYYKKRLREAIEGQNQARAMLE